MVQSSAARSKTRPRPRAAEGDWMNQPEIDTDGPDAIAERAAALLESDRRRIYTTTSRLFGVLMAAQWAFGVLVAVTISPYAWEGKTRTVHGHVFAAVVLGGLLSSLPVFLAVRRPAWVGTRHVI